MYSKVLSVKILTEQEIFIPDVETVTKAETVRAINALNRAAAKHTSFLKRIIQVGLSSRSAKAIAAVLSIGALSAFIVSAIKYFGKKGEGKKEKKSSLFASMFKKGGEKQGGTTKPNFLTRVTTPKSLLIIGIALTVLAITAYIYSRAKAKAASQLESDVLFADSFFLYEDDPTQTTTQTTPTPTPEETNKEIQKTTESVIDKFWNWIKKTFQKAINFLFKKKIEGKEEYTWDAPKIILIAVLAAAAITTIVFIKRRKRKTEGVGLTEQEGSSVTQIRIVDAEKTVREFVDNLRITTLLKFQLKLITATLIIAIPFLILGAIVALVALLTGAVAAAAS
jgi:hypothetical protein